MSLVGLSDRRNNGCLPKGRMMSLAAAEIYAADPRRSGLASNSFVRQTHPRITYVVHLGPRLD